MRRDPRALILQLVEERGAVRNRDVADRLGISRQAVHHHLQALVQEGRLVRVGGGRGTLYRPPSPNRELRLPTAGLEEEHVWTRLLEEAPALDPLPSDATGTLQYVVTELVNNAIDHSDAREVTVRVESAEGRVVIEVEDEGVGVFERIRGGLGLESELEALQELSKGKTTTMPSRHTGEGIFFSSKAGSFFRLEGGELAWLVDNERDDVAVEFLSPPRRGTLAHFELDPEGARPLHELFDAYTEDYAFTRTRTIIKLFAIGVRFISRSEAKRLTHGLEKFDVVVLDFAGVRTVGQGFADEVFRVWARLHPDVRLECVNMAPGVEFMVERARRREEGR